MSVNTSMITLNELHPVNDLFDLLNGNSNILIVNPFFAVGKNYFNKETFFTIKDLNAGTMKGKQLCIPDVLFKINSEYKKCYIYLTPSKKDKLPCKLFDFYNGEVKVKFRTSMSVSFDDKIKLFSHLCWQITQAVELMITAIIFGKKISESPNAVEFVKNLFESLDISKKGTKYLELLKNNTFNSNNTNKNSHLLNIIGTNAFDDVEPEKEIAKGLKNYFNNDKRLYIAEGINIKESDYTKPGKTESKHYTNYNAKLAIRFKDDKYIGGTTYIQNHKIILCTPKLWKDLSSNSRVNAVFIIDLIFDCRTYGAQTTPSNTLMLDVIQFYTTKIATQSVIDSCLIDIGDDEKNEDKPNENDKFIDDAETED